MESLKKMSQQNIIKLNDTKQNTLILGNIDHLIDFKEDFGAVRELYIDQHNTGVMVIGKKYLNPQITQNKNATDSTATTIIPASQ